MVKVCMKVSDIHIFESIKRNHIITFIIHEKWIKSKVEKYENMHDMYNTLIIFNPEHFNTFDVC